jgi:hypothetical protein
MRGRTEEPRLGRHNPRGGFRGHHTRLWTVPVPGHPELGMASPEPRYGVPGTLRSSSRGLRLDDLANLSWPVVARRQRIGGGPRRHMPLNEREPLAGPPTPSPYTPHHGTVVPCAIPAACSRRSRRAPARGTAVRTQLLAQRWRSKLVQNRRSEPPMNYLRVEPMSNQCCTQLKPLPCVHRQHPHGRSPRARSANNHWSAKREVIRPDLRKWIKQALYRASLWVYPRQIRTRRFLTLSLNIASTSAAST